MTATLNKRPTQPAIIDKSVSCIDAQNAGVKMITPVRGPIPSKSRNDLMLTINTGYLLHGPLPIASFSTIFEQFSQSRRRPA